MKYILVFAISIQSLLLFSQDPSDSVTARKEFSDTTQFLANLDSLMEFWYIKQAKASKSLTRAPQDRDTNYNPVFPDSVYLKKITDMNSIVDLSYNKRVQAFIDLYANKRRDQVEYMLGLSEYYFPIFEEILDANGMPIELKYLSIIESALNPRATSKARAVGLWQFMYSTGKMYGLKINSFVDERCDPIKSSYAAAAYLKDLNDMFDDWILALAAYNCGPGNVRKAIRRSGGKRSYWDIYNYLPRETRGYVPAFIAAQYVMEHHEDHNLYPKEITLPYPIDTIMVTQKMHLKQVAEVLGIPFAQLSDMNPHYRVGIIPNSTKGNTLYLPAKYSTKFIELEDSIVKYKDSVYLNTDHIVEQPPSYKGYVPSPPIGKSKVTYTIKSGDNLGYISTWFNVRISDLRYWNGISGNTIRSGQKLAVYVSPSKKSHYQKFDSMTFAQKQAAVGKTASAETKTTTSTFTGEYTSYTVKSGDTLWAISKKFAGVTEQDIMKANGISNARSLSPGMKLKIPKK